MKEIGLRKANWIYQQHNQDVGPKISLNPRKVIIILPKK